MEQYNRAALWHSHDHKKNIDFATPALASLPWVRYNDPPDLIVERIQ
jgi:hypothetical protein